MTNNNQGSALFMVMCFSSAMSLMVLSIYRNAMYKHEAALKRVNYGQLVSSAEGLLYCALDLGIENYAKIAQQTEEISIEFPSWVAQQKRVYTGLASFRLQKEHIEVRAALICEQKIECSAQCTLKKNVYENNYIVDNWAINS